MMSLQAPPEFLKPYRPINHEDGLETAIMGLEFEVTPLSFDRRHKPSLNLKCSSSVVTVNSDAQIMETHHQRSIVHKSRGSFFRSSGQSSKSSTWLGQEFTLLNFRFNTSNFFNGRRRIVGCSSLSGFLSRDFLPQPPL